LSGVALFVIAYQTGRMDIADSLAVLVGSLLGFLRYNFHPAKIFMGDSGSMFLGYFIGAITIQSAAKSAAMISLLVPLVIMGIPVFDAAYAIFRRFINRRPLTRADKEHIHHILLHKGLSHKSTVLLMYGWTLVLSIIGLALSLRIDIFWNYRVIILVMLLPTSFFLAYYSGLFDWLVKAKDKEVDSGSE
ncbi:MAG: undecaprenyl/decaprenyl-phosphate alpha-N-acetylglucosaminyl 1-phosphate transferase, partial [Actinobacteria bacterium]